MAENMWERCWDWASSSSYASSPGSNPTGPASGSYRVLRGGSWFSNAVYARTAGRDYVSPGNDYSVLGFRCVRSSVP
jgi:formylglycine-generating enzyme